MKHLLLAIVMSSVFSLPVALSFAQEQNGTGLGEENDQSLNSTSTDTPLLEKVSDKGIYKVQLRWPQVPLSADNSIDLQLVFLDANASNATLPEREGNFSGSGSEAGLTVPGTVDSPLPVKSYDIAIYSGDGTELWKKVNQPGEGGRPGQHVELLSNYTGPVTVEVTNIQPGWDVGETATAEDMTDSVKFSATIVPEFPVAAVMLAAGIAGTLAMLRWRKQVT